MPWTDLEAIGEDLWDKVICKSQEYVFGCKICCSDYEKGEGVMINTASMGAVRIRPHTIPYVVSKGGVITLTRALALELAPYHIRVNSISPAVVDTPLFRKIIAGTDFTEAKKAMMATIPLGKFAEAKDIAHAALYLASDEASMITGINLQVDGGRGI
jgi:3-oxoacyl-[acyl-carrier protein] reductase